MASNSKLAESQLSESGKQEVPKQMNLPASESVNQAPIVVSSSSEETESEPDREGSRSRAAPAIGAGTSAENPSGNSEPAMFERIWSLGDEIVILRGLIKYSREKGSDPMADLGAFLDYIKGDLELDCTRKQLKHKINSLKRKYRKHRCKEVEEGVPRTFSSRHKQRAYRLSGLAWGDSVLEPTKMGRPRGTVRKRPTPEDAGPSTAEVRKRAAPEEAGPSAGVVRVQTGDEGTSAGVSKRAIADEASTSAGAVRVRTDEEGKMRRDEGERSSSGVGEWVEKAWEEICKGEGDGEWKKKLQAEDVLQHCNDLQEKLLHSRFVLYVLSCHSSKPN